MSSVRTLEEAMTLTRSISAPLLLDDEEAVAFWNLVTQVPKGGMVVEIGCQRGRSSSLILQAAEDIGFLSIHIDPWPFGEALQWMEMAQKVPVAFGVLKMTSEQALRLPWLREVPLDLVYIDGNHEAPLVAIDIQWGDSVRAGGLLCAHDYGRDFLQAVRDSLDAYAKPPEWQLVGVWGTLAAWRRTC